LQQNASASYACAYTVEFVHDGRSYRQRTTWLSELYESTRGEDCGAERYGETIAVWLQEGDEDSTPKVRKVGDRREKPMTTGFLLLIGIAFLYGSYRLGRGTWRRWRTGRMTE
jgi:hypothetical protein